MTSPHSIGKHAEEKAESWYNNQGYTILTKNERNYGSGGRGQKTEIDLIAYKDNLLICIEVKTRKNKRFGSAIETIGRTKINNLMRGMQVFVHTHKQFSKCNIRFDAAIWENQELRVIPNII